MVKDNECRRSRWTKKLRGKIKRQTGKGKQEKMTQKEIKKKYEKSGRKNKQLFVIYYKYITHRRYSN